MAVNSDDLISEEQLLKVVYTMMVLPSIFAIARVGIQVWRRKAMQTQDYLLYSAFIFFLAMSICYLIVVPKIYMVDRVQKGMMEPPITLAADVAKYVQLMFVTTTFFWLSLWLVKLSLLALYKKLITGLSVIYARLWWTVFAFCLIVSSATSKRSTSKDIFS